MRRDVELLFLPMLLLSGEFKYQAPGEKITPHLHTSNLINKDSINSVVFFSNNSLPP